MDNLQASRRSETLCYLQSMLGQLRLMAEAERCDMVAYLIGLAYIEISDIIRGERPLRVAPEAAVGSIGENKRNGTA